MLENKSSARPNVGSLSLALFAFPSWPVSRCPVSPGETTPLKKAPGAKAKTRSHHRSAVQRTVLNISHAAIGLAARLAPTAAYSAPVLLFPRQLSPCSHRTSLIPFPVIKLVHLLTRHRGISPINYTHFNLASAILSKFSSPQNAKQPELGHFWLSSLLYRNY